MTTVFCCFLEFFSLGGGDIYEICSAFPKDAQSGSFVLFGLTHVITLGCEVGSSVKCANLAVPFAG